ncbi:helix-hairpin-helix domain-containing protein [Aquimarina algiphila]|uniref:Helix-hairpin-helix domain-containing protein n=1 Tax=Aquimarina algiphila TaxID=2047982 RepID=A0A554VDT7_9FLAO|nr:helix-hairpin-helix domain-containing protein [Aquimarina algiphila]TSE05096.1 helix-hairpin-helix domain-containing protein [Aquimarina algiphila]
MKHIRSHFEIHTRFRNGIFLLSIILLLTILGYYFYPEPKVSESSFIELTEFQNQIDSLKEVAKNSKTKYRVSTFNPNFISDHKGYVLGLSAKELDRLHEYRNKGKWINSVSDFKKVTQVSDSLLKIISPLFRFPVWIKNNKTSKSYFKKKYPSKSYAEKKDLNSVTSEELQKNINVPDFIAERIIRYRNKIGGFVSDIQLQDISGLYDHQRNMILSLFTVKTPKTVKRMNINTISVKDLMDVPYFDFETALDIKDFIESNGDISDFTELKKIEGFSLEKIDRIKLYLTLN